MIDRVLCCWFFSRFGSDHKPLTATNAGTGTSEVTPPLLSQFKAVIATSDEKSPPNEKLLEPSLKVYRY